MIWVNRGKDPTSLFGNLPALVNVDGSASDRVDAFVAAGQGKRGDSAERDDVLVVGCQAVQAREATLHRVRVGL